MRELHVQIQVGCVFDGASIPRPLWFLFNPVGIFLIAGLIHDFGYRYDYLYAIDSNGYKKVFHKRGQKAFDVIFFDISREINGLNVASRLAYWSIRAFGFMAWRKNRKLAALEVVPELKWQLRTARNWVL